MKCGEMRRFYFEVQGKPLNSAEYGTSRSWKIICTSTSKFKFWSLSKATLLQNMTSFWSLKLWFYLVFCYIVPTFTSFGFNESFILSSTWNTIAEDRCHFMMQSHWCYPNFGCHVLHNVVVKWREDVFHASKVNKSLVYIII